MPSLNGSAPLDYRIGSTDRPLAVATDSPEGFIVLNNTTGAAFVVTGGVWADATGTFDADLLAAWYATIPAISPDMYRVGTSDRDIGPTDSPNGFIVINQTNNSVFQVVGGDWSDVTGSFNGTTKANLLAAWLNA